jgi:hypothetical protein
MGVEEEEFIERIEVTIEKRVLIQTLLIGFFCFIITGLLVFYLSCCIIVFGLCLVIGSTLGFLGIYFNLIAHPLFQTSIKTCSSEEEEDLEYQSIMKIE